MKCTNCGFVGTSQVVDSRKYKNETTVRRKRLCNKCHHSWYTLEISEDIFNRDRYVFKYLPWTEGELINLISMYQDGMNKSEIARYLGRSRMSVSRKLDKLLSSGEYFEILETEVSK